MWVVLVCLVMMAHGFAGNILYRRELPCSLRSDDLQSRLGRNARMYLNVAGRTGNKYRVRTTYVLPKRYQVAYR